MKRLLRYMEKRKEQRDKEYSKRMLHTIVHHSMWMMWASYVLAWFGRAEIAEALSKTIATSIIAVVITYLGKSVVENISKNTDTFGKNINTFIDNKEDSTTEPEKPVDIEYWDSGEVKK